MHTRLQNLSTTLLNSRDLFGCYCCCCYHLAGKDHSITLRWARLTACFQTSASCCHSRSAQPICYKNDPDDGATGCLVIGPTIGWFGSWVPCRLGRRLAAWPRGRWRHVLCKLMFCVFLLTSAARKWHACLEPTALLVNPSFLFKIEIVHKSTQRNIKNDKILKFAYPSPNTTQ